MQIKYCFNNLSCPCPMFKQSGICMNRGIEQLKKKENLRIKEQVNSNFRKYCKDMSIDLNEIDKLLKFNFFNNP